MVNVNLTYLVASSCWLEGKMKPCTEINSFVAKGPDILFIHL